MKQIASSPEKFPRRVLVINPIAELGGAERVLLDFIASTQMATPGLAFHVLAFADGPMLAELERLGVGTSVLPLPFSLSALGDSSLLSERLWKRGPWLLCLLLRSLPLLFPFIRSLRTEIARRAPDIIHSNGIKAHFLSCMAAPREIPIVWHIHDFLGQRPFAGLLLRAVAHRASAGIAVSGAVNQDARRMLPLLRIVTIHNAVDVDEFSPGTGDGVWLDNLAEMAPAKPGTVRIGLIASYARWKGQDVFLRAAARIRGLRPSSPVRFYIVGGPLYATHASQFSEKELGDLIVDLGLTDVAALIPFQAKLPPVLRSFDIIVHASTRPEPFGRTIVEAMACARPVAFAGGSGAEEFFDNPLSALAHQPGNVADLTRTLSVLLNDSDLCRRVGTQARRTAVSQFSRQRTGSALLQLYCSILSAATG